MSENSHPFKNLLREFSPYLKRLPARISQRAVLEIKGNFDNQGYEDDSGRKIKWKERKIQDKKSRRAILIWRGRLKRSIRSAPIGSMPRVVTDVEYAEALNDGLKGTVHVRPHKRVATIKRKVSGGYAGLGKKKKTATLVLQGSRYNVKGHTRQVNMPARPFMTVGPSFLNREETKLLDELENIFLRA